jgi:hypothetical protein
MRACPPLFLGSWTAVQEAEPGVIFIDIAAHRNSLRLL